LEHFTIVGVLLFAAEGVPEPRIAPIFRPNLYYPKWKFRRKAKFCDSSEGLGILWKWVLFEFQFLMCEDKYNMIVCEVVMSMAMCATKEHMYS